MLFHLLFLAGCVVGDGELLGDFLSQEVFYELGFFDAGFASKASGLDFDVSIV